LKALSGSTESTVPAYSAEAIRDYYDRQTRGFLALGEGGAVEAIHRAVWAPDVRTADEAFHFTERRMIDWLSTRSGGRPHIVDLGCGVGGSLRYVARHLPMTGTGVTLSPVQAALGTARSRAEGLAETVHCLCGDFNEVPLPDRSADAVMAIEAFVHGAMPARFFAEAARLLTPDGRLWLCDDFRTAEAPAVATRSLDRFARGWQLNSLLPPEVVIDLAREAGLDLVRRHPLTSWLRLGRPRDHLIAAGVALFGWLPLERTPVAHLVGGAALQRCLARGWVTYELLEFSRTAR
jgi:cyclopropane fatty-acyl-phospholipid synthase-like methyltransferase